MAVGIVGDGPAAAALEAAMTDVAVATERIDPAGVPDTELTVVIDTAGASPFETVSDRAGAAGVDWMAVELGGVGGVPVVDAAVTGLGPAGPCYTCLRGRVAATAEGETTTESGEGEASAAGGADRSPAAPTVRFAGAMAGRLAARAVTEELSVVGRLSEIDGPDRTVLPLPNCGCTDDPATALPRTRHTRSLDDALARAERGLDERVGLVREVGEIESVPLPYYLARTCETAGFSDVSATGEAAGVALGWNEAFMKALGEALERYAAGIYRAAEFRDGPTQAIPDAVDLDDIVTSTDPDRDESMAWVAGHTLGTDRTVHLPAELVYYPPPSEHLRPAITTGLGLGNDGAEALIAGLTEVVERDAAMLAWYSSFEPLGLAVADDDYTEMVRRARTADLSVRSILLTQDVDVPVVAAAVSRDAWPRFAVGSSAAFDPNRAARGALAEALQNWMELEGMGPEAARSATGRIGEYAEDPGDAAAFFDVETTVPAASVGPSAPPTGWDAVDAIEAALAAADLDAYTARLTTADLESLGFEVVRGVVPGAQPLFFEAPYFGNRISSVPQSLGYEARTDRPHHPFP